MVDARINEEQVVLLLEDMMQVYGFDFTHYSKASLSRRINRLYHYDKWVSFAEYRYHIRSDKNYARRFIEEITVNVTEMFRDPTFYKTLRTVVLPILATHPFIRIWHAGCSTGEEVYSMAILLQEAGLLHKTLLYATDINPQVIEKARKGIFPLNQMKQYSENYLASGGQQDFSSYYSAHYNKVKLIDDLSAKMIFATHNLVSDSSFNEFQLILCRNVLIYFEKELQDQVLQLFDDSLDRLGFISLGSKETIQFSPIAVKYKQVGKEKIWRKME